MRIFYQLQRSTPGHKAFRDWQDPWTRAEVAAHYAVRALRQAKPGTVVRVLPFGV